MMPGTNRHILSEFDTALNSFRNDAIMMASLTRRNLDHAQRGLFELDEDHCNTAIADHQEICLLERQMEGEGMNLLMRFQPVASDLRVVIATMKISINLERISELAVNIARRARKLIGPSPPEEIKALKPLFEHATLMLDDAIAAFTTGNLELEQSLKTRDRELAAKGHELASNITTRMSFELDDGVARYLELIFIIRHLEQIGNFTTNFGEDIVLAYSNVPPNAGEES
jgi:phosphate transport system protein